MKKRNVLIAEVTLGLELVYRPQNDGESTEAEGGSLLPRRSQDGDEVEDVVLFDVRVPEELRGRLGWDKALVMILTGNHNDVWYSCAQIMDRARLESIKRSYRSVRQQCEEPATAEVWFG